jgi:hypothetical protein
MFGKGCNPNAAPAEGEETELVWDLVEQERGLEYALQRCVTNNPQSLLLQGKCREGTGRGYTSPEGPIQLARDEITAYCMMAGAQADVDVDYTPPPNGGALPTDNGVDPGPTDPIETQAGMSSTMKMGLVAGCLVLVLGAGYMFTRKKR